jgi:phosphohistidine phosphatase SixA
MHTFIYLVSSFSRCFYFFKGLNTFLAAFAAASLLGFTMPAMAVDFANLSGLLQGQQHVLMMRHADAPGFSDPAGYNLQDCATQRNLGERGRQQAVEIGQWLKAQGVNNALVLTSPWCRTRDTGIGMAVGEVKDETSLGSFFEDRSVRKTQNAALQATVGKQLLAKGGRALIMVSHQVNISEYSGEYLASGAMVLVKVDALGKPISTQRLSAF